MLFDHEVKILDYLRFARDALRTASLLRTDGDEQAAAQRVRVAQSYLSSARGYMAEAPALLALIKERN